jgi:hypothetical protein
MAHQEGAGCRLSLSECSEASKRACSFAKYDAWYWHLADMAITFSDVRFSNRPFGVKHFQTIRRCQCATRRGRPKTNSE